MSKSSIKLILILLVLGFAVWNLYPSYRWFTMSKAERENRERLSDTLIKKALNLGLDIKGGMNLILELDTSNIPDNMTLNEAQSQSIEIIRNRIDQFGVAEPVIAKQGDQWITVQIPGIKNLDRAIELIGKTALLEFKLVDDKINTSDYINDAGEIETSKIPAGIEILKGKDRGYYAVKKETKLTGAMLTNAEVKVGGDYGAPYVAISFNREGANLFSAITGSNINKQLAIVLDGVVQSAPSIRSRIPDGNAIIEGSFSPDEAKSLAIVLKAGALPVPVRIIESRVIGPTLGEKSIKASLYAGLFGMFLVFIFILIYYKFSGIIIDIALFLNSVIIFGMMGYFHATLTLPGIAGIILTIGMAVDANVLISERIKEELRLGKTLRLAVNSGYDKAYSSILDSNITTLIGAIFLFQFGVGAVKGFAVTLSIGILSSMFTSIFVTRFIYDIILRNSDIKNISI